MRFFENQIGEIIMKKVTVALLIASILTIGLVGLVFAQKRGGEGFGGHHGKFGGPGGMPPFFFGKIAEELGLSEEQKTQAKQVLEDSKTRVQPIMESLKNGHETAKTLGTNGTYDEKAVLALANQQAELTKQLIVEKEKTKAQLFAILTPEQRTKAQELMKNFEEKMKDGKGRFGHRPPFGGGEDKPKNDE
jgi:Spy/CpxP family protein refolding chaperone